MRFWEKPTEVFVLWIAPAQRASSRDAGGKRQFPLTAEQQAKNIKGTLKPGSVFTNDVHASSRDQELRARIDRIEAGNRPRLPVLPFGVPEIDHRLPHRGLVRGALHEMAGGSTGAEHGAAAIIFAAGILARLEGLVLWCLKARDLFAPGLAAVGLHPDRVIYAEATDEKTVMLCMEEGLRHAAFAGVIGETSRFTSTSSKRLQASPGTY